MAAAKTSPKDAQIMTAILKDMGVTEYEPRIVNQMMEFAYRYVTDILDDAKVYSAHACKKTIDVDDVKLAVQCKLDHSFTNPPPRELLLDIARHKNNNPLPLIKPFSGPKLPPDRYCLTAPNYRLKSGKKVRLPLMSGTPRIVLANPYSGASGPTLQLASRATSLAPQSAAIRSAAAPAMRVLPALSVAVKSPLDGVAVKRKREEDDDYDV